ncbi:MAG: hypothetical protein WDN31_21365 [Hyphomicrobium sp.]
MTARSNAIYAAAALACLLGGCADGSLGSAFNTGSIDPQKQAANEQAEKSKQALCNTLISQIDALNNEGTSDKVAKAAAKKYKLKATDLSKADELNKANAEFQGKCSDFPPRVAATAPIEPVTTATAPAAASTTPATKTAATAKAKPATPTPKPVAAAAMAPQETASPTSSAMPTTTATTDTVGVPNP